MPEHNLIGKSIPSQQFAVESFRALVDASPQYLALAIEWVIDQPIRLSLSDCKTDFLAFSARKGVDVPDAEKILGALFSLEGIRTAINWTGTNFSKFLAEETAKKDDAQIPGIDAAREALQRFFIEASAKLAQTLKAQRVYDGLLPNFQSCSSLVEFRPVYNEARTTILSGIVTATLTVEMNSPESGSDPESVSFQLDAVDIDRLAEELKYLKGKLNALADFARRGTDLVNPSKSLPTGNA
jgi:hypothetical protein